MLSGLIFIISGLIFIISGLIFIISGLCFYISRFLFHIVTIDFFSTKKYHLLRNANYRYSSTPTYKFNKTTNGKSQNEKTIFCYAMTSK